MELLIIFIISYTFFGIIWGLATQSIGKSKGHQNCFWWGFFLGLIGLIVVVCLNPKTNNQNNLIDNIDALDKLKRLQENGAITKEEFEENKKVLLNGIENKEDKNHQELLEEYHSVSYVGKALEEIASGDIVIDPESIEGTSLQ